MRDRIVGVVRGILRQDKKVLMVKATTENPKNVYGGLWQFPGGRMELGEAPETAVIREFKEETDLNVFPLGFLKGTANPPIRNDVGGMDHFMGHWFLLDQIDPWGEVAKVVLPQEIEAVEWVTPKESLKRVVGTRVYQHIPKEVWANLGFNTEEW